MKGMIRNNNGIKRKYSGISSSDIVIVELIIDATILVVIKMLDSFLV